MKSLSSTSKRGIPKRNVFRTKKKVKLPLWRQCLESIILLSAGSTLLILLNRIPHNVNWKLVLIESWTDLLSSIILILNAIINFTSFILLLLLVFLGFILLIGGLIRFFRILTTFYKLYKKNAKYSSMLRRKD